jgi:hypothetical protein
MQEKMMLDNHVIKPAVSIFDGDTEYRLLPIQNETSLGSKIDNLTNLMLYNMGKGKSEEEKDRLYEGAKDIWRSYTSELKEVAYTFYLTEDQLNYLLNLLKNDLEYDVNTVFFVIELEKMLTSWTNSQQTDVKFRAFLADATETTYMYHLLAKHKVKGLTKETHLFSEILMKIGEISKIVAFYDNLAKTLSKTIQDWVAEFDDPETSNQTHGNLEMSI